MTIDKKIKIYLDVCCLNRPFDDQTQDRIHLESEAVFSILEYCQANKWLLIGSEVIDIEIYKMPDNNRKRKVINFTSIASSRIRVDIEVKERALTLEKTNIKPFDALHLACAEKGKADVLLTTDDKFLMNAFKNKGLKVRVENPLTWLLEVIK